MCNRPVSNRAVSTEYFASYRCLLFVAALLVGAAACSFMNTDPPEIAKPLGYDTVDVSLPGCATPLPPVRDDINCGALEIGKSIDGRDVCHLLQTLKNWVASAPADAPTVHPDDWTRVRAVCVSREVFGRVGPSDQPKIILPPLRFLRLEADVPNRSLRMSVQMSEQSRGLEYSVSPR
jgi:hypothetical protein